MSIFKCKMCGGTLEINNETVATCEYCGTQQTLPKLNDDRRANLYDRANHFRRNNEFDKAAGIYEQILNEDNTDAETYWSLVLCRYGIEYVEDPASHKRVPTVNRAQFTSIFDDDNYKSALQYADGAQRHLYEEEAKAINEIQKGILVISQKEEPFDVFICYKETDRNGRRTPDSVLANELYHQLTQEGFKVFFSRITLEDKLGVAYEPYIFAALNSAKVMVALGTRQEHFNAVWVKNEWSRYLALIKNGAKKILIPAYRDMDPYDLPDEFSHLQAQDMSKLGFMQDLIRGIKKIVAVEETKQNIIKETVVATGNVSIAPLLKRAFMFLEDGDWDSADEYCEKVLDIDPECAQAYLGKLMVECKVRKQQDLRDCANPFDKSGYYQKVTRFADKKLCDTLSGYIDYIQERNENARIERIYQDAVSKKFAANTEKEYKDVAQIFATIRHFKDADLQESECLDRAEVARKDSIYKLAKEQMSKNIVFCYEDAIAKFKCIPDWKDSQLQIDVCRQKIIELKAKQDREQKEAAARAKRNKSVRILAILVIFVVISCVAIRNVLATNNKYNDAIALMEKGLYQEAIDVLSELEGYKDSDKKILDCEKAIEKAILDEKYNDAIALMNAGEYDKAISAFEILANHRDSKNKIDECNILILDGRYNDAIKLMNDGEIVKAYEAFVELGEYKDSTEKANSLYKKYTLKMLEPGDYIRFGSYEQDNNVNNGKEAIEWLILKVQGDKILVISKYAIDGQPYNTRDTNVTWETCTLRKWLNNDFLNSAFSEKDKDIISTTTVVTEKNDYYSTDPGNTTQDKIFLLSQSETSLISAHEYQKVAWSALPGTYEYYATEYAISKGEFVSNAWWLRTPGMDSNRASVGAERSVGTGGGYIVDSVIGVRPVMWIDLAMIE